MATWNSSRNRWEEELFTLWGDQYNSSYGKYTVYLYYSSITRSGLTVTLNSAGLYGVRANDTWTTNRAACQVGTGDSWTNVANNGTLYPKSDSGSPATFTYGLGSPSISTTGTTFKINIRCANTGFSSNWGNFQSGSPVQKSVNITCSAAISAISSTTAGSTLSGPTINVTKYDSGFTDNITLTYNSKTITRNNFTSSTLSFTEAERLLIFQAQGNSTTKSWTISGTTMNGSTKIGTFSGSVNITTEALASVSSANNFNVGDSTSYRCSKGGAGSFSVYARVTSTSGNVAGSTTNQTTDGTKTMSFTDSVIYSSNTSSQSGTIYWTVTSYINGTSVGTTSGTTCNYTFLKSRCGPSLTTFKYAVTDAGTKVLMGLGSTTTYYDYNSGTNLNKFIQTKTTLGFQLNGSTASGSNATISKFYVKIPGQSDITANASGGVYVCGSGVLTTSGTIYGYIRDSRGFEDLKSFTYTLNDYSLSTFIYNIARNPMSSTDANIDKYAKLSATISLPNYMATYVKNTGDIYIAYKATTSSTWNRLSIKSYFTVNGATLVMPSKQLSIVFEKNTQYNIRLEVKDYYNSSEANYVKSLEVVLPISAPLLSKRYQALGINKIPSSDKALDIRGSENIENGNLDVSGYIKAGAPIYSNTKQLQSYYRISLSSLDSTKFYPVTFTQSDNILDCEIHSVGGGADLPYNQNVIHFQLLAQGWSDTPKHFNILTYERYNGGDEITIGSIGYGTRGGGCKCVWLRGSLNYDFYCNFTPTLHTSNYTTNNETYTVGTGYAGDTNTNVTLVFTPQNGKPSLSLFSGLNRSIIDIIYPVGSIYMSVGSTDPGTLFPGTSWTQLKDRFLLGAGSYSNGATGGYTATQKHTHIIPPLSGSAASAGSHSHRVTNKTSSYAGGKQDAWRCMSFDATNADWYQDVYSSDAGAHTHDVTTAEGTTDAFGTGAAATATDGNMPPYLVVYMWKRTA